MSAPMKRVVPWVDWSEWSNVYQELFSGDPQCQRHALNRIAVWRCRVPQRLATAIDCTSQLVCAQLQETRARSEGALRSRDQELCMGYAMVLVRFVNLLTEKRQTRFYPLPVHAIAEELGLPQWLVELRHDITHSSFPSLPVLRQATHEALQWLKQQYWEVQQKALEEDKSELTGQQGSPVDSVRDLLQDWVNRHTEVSSTKSSGDVGDKLGDNNTLQKLKRHLNTSNLRDVALDWAARHMTSGGDILEKLQINQPALLESDELTLPLTLVSFWQPLLQLFHQSHATPLLLEKLLQLKSDSGGLQDRLVVGWVAAIVTAICKGHLSGSPLACVYEAGYELDGTQLMRLCLRNPNRLTPHLLNRLFTDTSCDMSVTQRHQLVKLVSLYTQASVSDNDVILDDTDRVLEALHRYDQSSSHDEAKSGRDKTDKKTPETPQLDTRWQQMKEPCDWSLYGFGDGPGCTVDYRNLELDESVVNVLGSLRSDPQDNESLLRCESMSADCQHDMEVDTNDDCDIRASETECWTEKELYELKQEVTLF